MLRYVAQRLALSVPVFLSVVTIVFLVVRVLPGDPAQAALGDYASKPAVDALRTRLGLDAPLPVQYVRFLADLARGDLGVSMINGTPVRDQVAYNLPFTLQLTRRGARSSASLLGLPVGVYDRGPTQPRARLRRPRPVPLAGLSVPAFYLGILLILLFGVQLKWLPAIGGGNPNTPAGPGRLPGPAGADAGPGHDRVGCAPVALGHAQRARARSTCAPRAPKVCANTRRAVVHTLRPALLPIVSLTGIWAVALIGDSVTTELVFARPGLGKMMVGAMLQRDYTALQSVMVVYTLFVVGINLVTDLAYGLVDPRIEYR